MYKRSFPCRCLHRACKNHYGRRSLPKHPDDYVRATKKNALCPSCGLRLSVDKYRHKGTEAKRNNCSCGGMNGVYLGKGAAVHRRGSLYCVHYKGPEQRQKEGRFRYEVFGE